MLLLVVPACLYIPDRDVELRLRAADSDADADADTDTDTDADPGPWYPDVDGDGSGDVNSKSVEEEEPGYVQNAWDCADDDPTEPIWVAVDGLQSAVGTFVDPVDSVATAIYLAQSCVRIRAGTYLENLTTGGKPLDLAGVDGAERTILSGTGQQLPVFTVQGSETVTLSGLTLTNGRGFPSGSDFYAGGGLYTTGSTVTLVDVVLRENTADSGGGLSSGDSTVTLVRVRIEGNDAYYGGALSVAGGSISADDLAVVDNTGGYGVAGGVSDTVATFRNVTTNANRSTAGLDGFYVDLSTFTLTDATLVDADVAMSLIASTATLTNVIIAETPTAAYTSGSLGFVMTYSDASGADFLGVDTSRGDGNITADPMFTELTGDGDGSNDDLSLLPGSPCVNSGDPALFDADGSRSDMGAAVP